MTPIFFDTFFNLEKYLDHEQRDPFASQRDVDEDGNEVIFLEINFKLFSTLKFCREKLIGIPTFQVKISMKNVFFTPMF